MSSRSYMAYSPSPSPAPHSPHIVAAPHSPHIVVAPHPPHILGLRSASSVLIEQEKYLNELLVERQKLIPFTPVLPHCLRLVNQEILRVTTVMGNASILDQTGFEHARPLHSGGLYSNGGTDLNGWPLQYQSKVQMPPSPLQHSSPMASWLGSQDSSSGLIVKRTIRVDIPVDKYPNFNFVGRLLGPRGNSLKRVEAVSGCRVLIRGHGSIKDPTKEENMRGKPGYEHLNEPLHILVEGEMPVEIIDDRLMQAREILDELLRPVDESQDFIKKQQLRELALLNGTLCDNGSHMSGSISPFNTLKNNNIKRAKTQG